MTFWRGGKPIEGDPEISFEYMDAKWVFSSTENRDAFAAQPEAYAPQYGGYCAFAASQGAVADVDVYAWRIYNGKLYLNYSPARAPYVGKPNRREYPQGRRDLAVALT